MALVAAGFRLQNAGLTEFQDDEAAILRSAVDMLVNLHLPLTTGRSFSIGIHEPPLTTFLLAIPALLSRNPLWASFFTGMMDVAAAILVYNSAKRLAGRRAGLAAGLLYALAPAAIVSSRRLGNPDMLPFFMALALYALIRAVQARSSGWLATALVALLFLVQLHPSAGGALLLWPGAATYFAFRRWALKPGPLLLGVALVGLATAPYLVLQMQENWS
ncbi:MAG TPA: glycosyltransferase family 39 protein, partial [Chloroflexota bacterium]